jgi:opacity protein-like surface antigen
MKNFKIIVFTLLSLTLITKTYSQGNVSIHFGPSFPVSDFASDDIDDEDAGGAAVGLNVGLQYIYPLSESGLGLFCGIDMNYNGLKKDVKDDVEELYEAMGINNPDIKYYKYINIPLTAGLNYTYQADDKIGVFANAGLAVNFMKITDMELKANGQTVTTEMDLANSIGFKIGGGILINQKTSISIDYLALGEHDIEGELKTTGYSEDIDGEGKVDLLTLTLGFKF